ncbi:MAG: helix-turn-helix domain-containing protein [Mycobacterium sp.]
MDVVTALANAARGATLTELARDCGITTSTCSLLLHDLEQRHWVHRYEDRHYVLGSGLLSVVHGLRTRFPLLDRGHDALSFLHSELDAACSLSRIGTRHLTVIDAVGHPNDAGFDLGQQFPIDPPFGLVAMAWHDQSTVESWLRQVEPRLTRTDIERNIGVLAAVRNRGYGAWRFDDDNPGLHQRLTVMLDSVESTTRLARQLTTLLTIVGLQSVTDTLETDLPATEFVVLPIFGRSQLPEYQIQIRLGRNSMLELAHLENTLRTAQLQLAPAL